MPSEPLKHDPDFTGPTAKRSCHDVFWLFLFFLFWIGMGLLGWQAYTYGDPMSLLYPEDTLEQYCGVDNSIKDPSKMNLLSRPYLYFLDPFSSDAAQVCVDTCPSTTRIVTVAADAVCTYGVTPANQVQLISYQAQKNCSAFTYASTPILYRCAPSNMEAAVALANSTGKTSVLTTAMNSQEIAQQIIGDFTRTWIWFLAFAGVSVGISLIWLVFMRFFTGFFVWVTTLLGLLAIDGFAVFFFFAWQDTITSNKSGIPVTDSMVREEQTYMGLFIGVTVIAVLANLVVLFLRKRINIAVQIVKESVRAVQAMPLLILFPVFVFVFMLALLAYWMAVALYIASVTTNPVIFGYQYDVTILKYLQWFNLFGLFWGQQFLSGINQLTVAGAVATWYWARDKRALPRSPVLKSFGRVVRYHLGSVALGSLIIALVQLIRVFLWHLQRQLRGSQNKAAKATLACCQCCFACVEKMVKFVNRNAYIEVAVYGKSFCTSAKNAFHLLLRNAFRLVAIDSVAMFVLFLGRLFVASLCGCGSYYWFKLQYASNPLNYTSASVVVVMIIAYSVSGVFFYVLDMAIDTIFLSFCEDCERNDGSPERPFYMSERLMLMANIKNAPASKKGGAAAQAKDENNGGPAAVTTTTKKKKADVKGEKVVKGREAFVGDV